MADHGVWSTTQERPVKLTHRVATFRGHELEAWTRTATMDDEAAILAAGIDPKTRSIRHYTNLLQEYIRRCVPKTNFDLTAAKLDDKKTRRDTDFLWFLYVWLDAQSCIPNQNRKDLMEAVQGKPTASSTGKLRTPSLKPESFEPSFGEEE